ncbi:MAG: hypothetical protein ABI415_11335 [Flavitalea sp.]
MKKNIAEDRRVNLDFILPTQFFYLCQLMNITPKQVLINFMDDLAQGSWKSEGRKESRELLKAYFISHHYGLEYYSKEDIEQIFEEVTAIGTLFPKNATRAILDMHTLWRDQYQKYWFEKWYSKRKKNVTSQD